MCCSGLVISFDCSTTMPINSHLLFYSRTVSKCLSHSISNTWNCQLGHCRGMFVVLAKLSTSLDKSWISLAVHMIRVASARCACSASICTSKLSTVIINTRLGNRDVNILYWRRRRPELDPRPPRLRRPRSGLDGSAMCSNLGLDGSAMCWDLMNQIMLYRASEILLPLSFAILVFSRGLRFANVTSDILVWKHCWKSSACYHAHGVPYPIEERESEKACFWVRMADTH